MKCDRNYWGRDVCGATLREAIDKLGRVGFACDACARYDAGVCAECPLPRDGRSRRCAAHRALHKKAWDPINYARNREAFLARKREKYRADAEFRRRCIEDAKRRQRAGAERTDIDRAYDRARVRRHRAKKRRTQRTAA